MPVTTQVNTARISEYDRVCGIPELRQFVETERHELVVAVTDVDPHPASVVVSDYGWEVTTTPTPTCAHCCWALKKLAVSKVRLS